MIIESRLLIIWSLLIILLHFLQISHASSSCSSSQCGIIRNISSPFRLRDDPKNCGDPNYELSCENNVPFIYVSSQKYLVKAVNYWNSTIRLADPSINNDTCSFPEHSTYAYNFSGEYPFSTYSDWIFRSENDTGVAWPINFMSCPDRLENSSQFTEVSDCVNGGSSFGPSNSSRARYTYVKVGHMLASDTGYKCSVDLIVMSSWKFKSIKNVRLSEIHDALLYGFELSWFQFRCIECKGGWLCTSIEERLDGCSDTSQFKLNLKWEQNSVLYSGIFWLILFLLLIIGFRLEVLIIAGFTFVWGLLILSNSEWFFNSVNGVFMKLLLVVVISYAAKIIIAFPFVMGILAYKFRRRHLSMFDDIEGFLQSDNNLVPIRYSYSDLKKMTRDFREKLGEGVARGIEYLHRGKEIQILHFDIKPHNILLDDKFTPKITDFGLAKFYSTEKNAVTLTAARGTIGYVAPELISRSIGAVSYKADVYSFGMLLMEMAGLKRDLTVNARNSSQCFPYWIYDRYNQGKDVEFGNGDEINEQENERDRKTIRKMTIVALWCIQMSPDDRPSMSKVLEMLEGDVERLQIPSRPFESMELAENEDQTCSTSSSDYSSLIRRDYPSSSLDISLQDSHSSTR